MTEAEMKRRTKQFALDCLAVVDSLPRNRACEVYGRQLIRCSSSVGANDRAVCRAKSDADMCSKLSTVEEEADECGYWLELLVESGNLEGGRPARLLDEADQLTAMIVAARKTIGKRAAKDDSRSRNVDSGLAMGERRASSIDVRESTIPEGGQ